ncbi:MAG: hypothetical protein M0Z58_06795 [Nitrospiraceae bacterium]|nr:hypothetical protein [Nitrospiraceae bacterium]
MTALFVSGAPAFPAALGSAALGSAALGKTNPPCGPGAGKILDRTVAFVDDDAILSSELEARYALARKLAPGITRAQVLQTMINRTLLLRQARQIFPPAMSDEQAIRQFTDFKIRAFVVVPESAVRDFYEKNKAKMGSAPYERVRGRIERLLKEKEINRRLLDYIRTLRQKADIRVFLTNAPPIFR